MHAAPHDLPIRRPRRRCPGVFDGQRCGNPASFTSRGRSRSNGQHDLCEACWRRAYEVGNARGKKLLRIEAA